ncbi:Nucleoside-diphosphate-sugar epimerase [Cohaesibacter sp. ES.047]|uniref:D-erythronate dehydrogenase n=1 Tax=Cohaesibacter sp. ES.047 TaxID=1798205 RepID=UPI000BB79406|nr:D-erythronate dehydrogenase [Cohaesibacter sp. ES.047]SNY91621.1 Nucleoside-diphosphate-sugar epimerase [Cohaesibacter sp. ES.047]
MKILVTGAGGFVGQRVVRKLIELGTITVDGVEAPVTTVYACDLFGDAVQGLADEFDAVEALAGDLTDPAMVAKIKDIAPDIILHLAAVVSSAAEADFDLGMKVNVDALRSLIDCCRAQPKPPVLVFTSSIAVFSCEGNAGIDESCTPMPLSSYGMEKVVGEYLVRDASRKGFVRGRTIRFPTIAVRPGKPNSAASSFASGIIREPLAGQEAILPVSRSIRLHLGSPDMAVGSVVHAISLKQDVLGDRGAITLPGLSVSVEEMIGGLRAIAGDDVAALVKDQPDAKIEAIVATWPGSITTPEAEALGFKPDAHFDDLITAYKKAYA